jgi:general secretion pathway protein F
VPVYTYRGVSDAGKAIRGFVDAESDRSARAKLRRDGVFLTELAVTAGAGTRRQDTAPSRFSFEFMRRVGGTDLAIATRQLATLIGAGIPLVGALGALSEQVENTRLKSAISQVRDRVNEGASLGDALSQISIFGDLYVSMVRAGETGGALEQVLERLADYLESQVRTRNKVVSIMIYPAIMFAVAIGVVVALVTVVLPQITQLLDSLNQPLPFYTLAIIGLSNALREYWWALLLVTVIAVVAFRATIRTERGRTSFDAFKLRMPVFGKVVRQLALARFTRTLSTLLAGGIPIVRALDIAKHVANNAVIGSALDAAREAITEGASIAAPLRRSGHFPPLVTHMVEVGERSGELEAMLAKVADTYDEQVENSVSRMTALLEPVLILIMVGLVLGIILATLVPLLEITSAIQ